MDRWTGADDDIDQPSTKRKALTGVAKDGMGAFVKSAAIGTEGASFGSIEVLKSRKEQRSAQAIALMPPPPPPSFTRIAPGATGAPTGPAPSTSAPPGAASAAAAGGPPPFPTPPWASHPPSGAVLKVTKDGVVVQQVPLIKPATTFGRHINADVVLDHASVSRLHAAVCFQGMTGKCLVMDLGSAHKTWVDGRPVEKEVPVELREGGELRFAASTRCYIYSVQRTPPTSQPAASTQAQAAAKELTAPPAKRAKVSFAGGGGDDDGADERTDGTAQKRGAGELAQVVGFSDSRSFAPRIGPTPVEVGGRFEKAVSSTLITSPHSSTTMPSTSKSIPADRAAGTLARQTSGLTATQASMQQQLRSQLPKTGVGPGAAGGLLYATLPPPEHP